MAMTFAPEMTNIVQTNPITNIQTNKLELEQSCKNLFYPNTKKLTYFEVAASESGAGLFVANKSAQSHL
jgi:hypothetical protein